MRIVVVSGHYPPNFVSGGSLQPQRLAHGLRRLGHDVDVFAGRMDAARDPLSSWDEVDDEGMRVHWVVTTPFEPWHERANFDNPQVRDEFARFLDEVRPDVVHLHDLQMLGGSLVRTAAEHGARVVVTMHDFWWICARLFLVDEELRPCSIVTAAGACRCAVDERWRVERTAHLAAELARADLVLAPSASAARVLVANGVAPGRVAVDENGLPEADLVGAPSGIADRQPHVPLVFAYAGGIHDLKGSIVLLRAAARLAAARSTRPWRLRTYGIDAAEAARLELPLADAPVDYEPAFRPSEREAVFSAMDVLVLPSIMIETHSILVREALARGVPVISTNTLGPEEVVVHGVNGLIVPAADDEALAAAMERVVEEAGLLEKLAAGASSPVRIRALADQVAGLDRRFRELVEHPPAPADGADARPPVTSVLFACGIEGAPLRYRARLPAEALAALGVRSEVRHYRDPALPRLVEEVDVLYVYRVPATAQFLDVIAAAKRRGIPVVFDVDDLIFDPEVAPEIPALRILTPSEAEGWVYGVHRYRTTLEHCDGFVGSTAMLVDHAVAVTGLPAARFDNGVGILLARASERARHRRRTPGPVRIGYLSGTITHDEDWFFVEPAVTEVLDRHPEVELWMVGHLPDGGALARFGARVRRIPFTPWLQLPNVLRDLDVNLAPLSPGGRFNEAKSAIKWLEAALVDTPTVASSTGPFREAIEHGATGYLCEDLDDWIESLSALVGDAETRKLVGQRARREALLGWSPLLQGQRLLEVLETARTWPALAAARSATGWKAAVADEPFEPIALEPYTASVVGPLQAARQKVAIHVEWYRARVRESVAKRGLGATVLRLPRVIARRLRHQARVVSRALRRRFGAATTRR